MAVGLPELHAAEKTISGVASWVKDDLGKLHLFMPLEVNRITIEGLYLRGRALKNSPDQELMLQLEYEQRNRRDYAIDRFDWRPVHRHNNRGKGPLEWRHRFIRGSHHHRFDLNWIPEEARMRKNNLPVALPVASDPANFYEAIDFLKKIFKINNVDIIPIPPWEGVLL